MLKFTHLLMEAKSKYSPNIKPYLKTHDILDSVDGFSHIALNYNFVPPIKIKTKPTIFIMKRKPNIVYDPAKSTKSSIADESVEEEFPPSEEMETETETKPEPEPETGPVAELAMKNAVPVVEDESPRMLENAPISSEETAEAEFESPSVFDMSNLLDSLEETAEELEASMEFIDWSSYEIVDEVPPDLLDEGTEQENETVEDKYREEFAGEPESPEERQKIDQPQPMEIKTKDKEDRRFQKPLETEVSPAPTVKEAEIPVIEPHKEGSGVKKAVRKLIQEKMQEVKVKQIVNEEIETHGASSKIVPKLPKPKTERLDSTKRIPKPVTDKVSNEERTFSPSDKKINEQKVTNVKESIRNIINQFREFEKDLMAEDPVSLKKWTDNDPDDVSSGGDNELGAASLEENINEMDKFIVENQDPTILNDAKKSLKEIIEQFKELKNELSSDEDDKFDEISLRFDERPISETLVHFSEALKNLVQRRKDKVNMLTVNGDAGKHEKPSERDHRNGAPRPTNIPGKNPVLVKKTRPKIESKDPRGQKTTKHISKVVTTTSRENSVRENTFSGGETHSNAQDTASSTNV